MTDRTLERDLALLGDGLYPPTPDLVAAVAGRLEGQAQRSNRPALRWATAVAVIVALAIGVSVLVPAVRERVTAWLGIGGVDVVEVEEVPEGLGRGLPLGEATTLEAAAAAAGFAPLLPAGLGPPDLVFLVDGTRAVSLVWAAGDGLPLSDAGVGAVLTQFRGDTVPVVQKGLSPGIEFEPQPVAGSPGLWIGGGPHVFLYFGPDGTPLEDTGRLAGNTLLWERDGVTFRLESALDRASAVTLAESVR